MTPSSEPPRRARVGAGDLAGSIADLGVFIPLASALVLINGLDGGVVLVLAGTAVLACGSFFRIPWPVQPLKALTAVAVALELDADLIHAAGIELGVVLLLVSLPPVMRAIVGAFTTVVVRGLQVGVGCLLVLSALRLAADPPPSFAGARAGGGGAGALLLGAVALGAIAWAVHARRYWVVAAVAGAATAVVVAREGNPAAHLAPDPIRSWGLADLPGPAGFGTAFTLLVIPQLPLTIGNAVVAVSDTARGYFGGRAARATPGGVARSAGVVNVVSGVLGGMPMCHGAGGLTAHYRLGARTSAMNLVLGSGLVATGLLYGGKVPEVLGTAPPWLLASLLAYAGIRHALLVTDLRGAPLAIAVAAGVAGAAIGNLAVTAAAAIVADRAARGIDGWKPARA